MYHVIHGIDGVWVCWLEREGMESFGPFKDLEEARKWAGEELQIGLLL